MDVTRDVGLYASPTIYYACRTPARPTADRTVGPHGGQTARPHPASRSRSAGPRCGGAACGVQGESERAEEVRSTTAARSTERSIEHRATAPGN